MSGSFGGLLWTLALALLVTFLFGLTMLPALIEFRWPRDVAPLKVVREHDGNAGNFAQVFSQFIEAELGAVLPTLGADEVRQVNLKSGAPCLLLGKDAGFALNDVESATVSSKQLVVGAGALSLPEQVLFETEVFAAGDFSCGSMSAFRAVLARGGAIVASESVVLRWIHANGELSVAGGSQLFGRATSDTCIVLDSGVEFERLHAPRLVFGMAGERAMEVEDLPLPVSDWQPGAKGKLIGGQWRVDDDVEIPDASGCAAPLVAIGALQVGAASWFRFAVKSNRELRLGRGCRVDDAVVASGRVDIGVDCRIKGPIISEVEVLLRCGTVVGTATTPATVSAPRIVIEPGVIVFGTVWARERGEVRLCT